MLLLMNLNKPVFIVKLRKVCVGDVLEAARFRGELDAPWRALLATADCGEESASVDAIAVQEASEEFRSERDLITAEETEQWLNERGLTEEDFGDFFVRRELAIRANAANGNAPEFENATGSESYSKAAPERRHQLHIDLLMTGQFDAMAERLAWRFAAVDGAGGDVGSIDLSALEEIFRDHCSQLLSEDACRRTLATRRLSLSAFDCEILQVAADESADSVKELLLCLRDDGVSMEDLARDTGFPMQRQTLDFEGLTEDLRAGLLGARPGEVLDPVNRGGCLELIRLLEKVEPTLDDPSVRRRVEEEMIQRHFTRLTAGCVEWRMLEGPQPV